MLIFNEALFTLSATYSYK